jgi:hypothetical protein
MANSGSIAKTFPDVIGNLTLLHNKTDSPSPSKEANPEAIPLGWLSAWGDYHSASASSLSLLPVTWPRSLMATAELQIPPKVPRSEIAITCANTIVADIAQELRQPSKVTATDSILLMVIPPSLTTYGPSLSFLITLKPKGV